MSKDLTNSAIDRQNILNNPYALAEIEKAAGIKGFRSRVRPYCSRSRSRPFSR